MRGTRVLQVCGWMLAVNLAGLVGLAAAGRGSASKRAAAVVFKPSTAGQWHSSSTLRCSDCHTLHYSEGGGIPARGEAGGPWKRLLLRSTVNGLCLSCHDGWDTNAPDILGPGISTDYSPDEHSGAGYLRDLGANNPRGHNLGYAVDEGASPPLAGSVTWTVPAGGLTCVDCHDPHGSPNYRNLKSDPNGDGTPLSMVSSSPAQSTDDVFQSSFANGSNPAAVYRRSNIGYRANYAAWCTECHGALAANTTGTSPAHFRRHPSNVSLNAAGYHTDVTNWTSGSPFGVGAATGDATFGIPRARFQAPGATSYVTATTVAADNQVFCGTCHLAHGGANLKGLAWPYLEASAQEDTYAGCEQCHNK